MKIRLCHIDTESIPEIGLEAEQPWYGFRLLHPKEYGCYVLMIGLGNRVIEIATGKGF